MNMHFLHYAEASLTVGFFLYDSYSKVTPAVARIYRRLTRISLVGPQKSEVYTQPEEGSIDRLSALPVSMDTSNIRLQHPLPELELINAAPRWRPLLPRRR